MLASACVTQKGVNRYFSKHPDQLQLQSEVFYNQHNDLLSKLCSEKFPVVTQLLPGRDTIIKTDTIPGPTVSCPDGSSVPCPPFKIITKTVRDTLKIEDTAKLAAAKAEYNDSLLSVQSKYNAEHDLRVKAELQRDDYKTKFTQYRKALIIESLIMAFGVFGFIYFKFK